MSAPEPTCYIFDNAEVKCNIPHLRKIIDNTSVKTGDWLIDIGNNPLDKTRPGQFHFVYRVIARTKIEAHLCIRDPARDDGSYKSVHLRLTSDRAGLHDSHNNQIGLHYSNKHLRIFPHYYLTDAEMRSLYLDTTDPMNNVYTDSVKKILRIF